jgi:hypothetical protein
VYLSGAFRPTTADVEVDVRGLGVYLSGAFRPTTAHHGRSRGTGRVYLSGASAAAQKEESMKGLPGVYVLVEGLYDAEGVGGLFERDIQTEVELALRTAGIKVLTKQEQLEHPALPSLYVNVNVFLSDDGAASYSMLVELDQSVTLWNGERAYGAVTWHSSRTGSVGRSNLWQLRETVKRHVSRFANDWLKVNPR